MGDGPCALVPNRDKRRPPASPFHWPEAPRGSDTGAPPASPILDAARRLPATLKGTVVGETARLKPYDPLNAVMLPDAAMRWPPKALASLTIRHGRRLVGSHAVVGMHPASRTMACVKCRNTSWKQTDSVAGCFWPTGTTARPARCCLNPFPFPGQPTTHARPPAAVDTGEGPHRPTAAPSSRAAVLPSVCRLSSVTLRPGGPRPRALAPSRPPYRQQALARGNKPSSCERYARVP